MADHSQAPVTDTIALQDELAELGVLRPGAPRAARARRASRGSRSAPPSAPRWSMRCTRTSATRCARRSSTRALAIEGVDLVHVARARRPRRAPRGRHREPRATASCASPPAASCRTRAGLRWQRRRRARGARRRRRRTARLLTPAYPDALARVWSALTCPTSGEVLLSAAPGYEFLDWGRQAHVGGGSHGSLHASDSLGALVLCGVALRRARARPVGDPRRRPARARATSGSTPRA